ncbi:YbaN family protein [Pseudomonadota bacterium]
MPKYILIIIGFIFVGLGALGLILPVMPTTPFLLVAAACFARSSERFYNWLMDLHLFGPIIKNWEETKSISRNTKLVSIASIVLIGGASVVFIVESPTVKLVVTTVLLLNILLITRIRTTETVCLAEIEN